MSFTKRLHISSNDRVSGSSHSFSIELPEAIRSVNKVRLVQASIPNTWYIINNDNNTLDCSDNTGDFTITLTLGNYTAIELASHIMTQLNTEGNGNYTVSYDKSIYKFHFENSTNNFELKFNSTNNNLHNVLGFANVDLSGSQGYFSSNVIYLSTPYIQLNISQFPTRVITTLRGGGYTFIVPVNANSSNFIMYRDSDFLQEFHYESRLNLYNLDIQLRGKNGDLLDLNGAEWDFILDLVIDQD
jgi:hypothetical protein